jgi:hypothetical protein
MVKLFKYLFIFSVLVISACKPSEGLVGPSSTKACPPPPVSKPPTSPEKDIVLESAKSSISETSYKLEIEESAPKMYKDGPPIKYKSIKPKDIPKSKFDSTSTSGSTSYSIPTEMSVRNNYHVYLKISHSMVLITETMPDKSVISSKIPVSESMEVRLVDDSPEDNKSFQITKDNSEIQLIENDTSFTEWNWTVTPIRSGDHKLSVVISTIKNGISKDIVYQNTVKVKINVGNQIAFFWKSYWQWTFSTLLIPIFLYFWKRRKKSKEVED